MRKTHPKSITTPQLERWVAYAATTLRPAYQKFTPKDIKDHGKVISARMLSAFGLKNPIDVITFLNSTTGKTTVALINEQMAEEEAFLEQEYDELLQHQRQKRCAFIFLLLGLLHRREVLAHRQHQHTQNEQEKHLKQDLDAQSKQSKASTPAAREIILNQMAALTEASKVILHVLNEKLYTAESLELSIKTIEKLVLQSKAKYAEYDVHLDKTYHEIAHWSRLKHIPMDNIQRKIEALTAQIDLDSDDISALIASGFEDEARAKLEISNAQNLQIAALLDMIAVIEGRKIVCNAQGETHKDGHPVRFDEATFILPKTLAEQKRLVCKNDVYYLIDANTPFEKLTLEDKAIGQKAYLQCRPDILGVKHLVEHNKILETTHHQEQQSRLSERSVMMQQDIALLASQLTKIQASCAEMALQLKPEPSPTPRMTPMPAQPTLTKTLKPSSPHWSHSSYHHMVQLMQANPTQSSLNWLKASVSESPNKNLKDSVSKLKPGQPIPDTLMKSLLQRRDLGSVWLNPANPDFTKTRLSPNPTPSTAPTPFSIRPRLIPT